MAGLSIFGVPGLPEITNGMDLGALIADAAIAAGVPLENGDIVVVTSKIVSKAEGRQVRLADIEVSPFAQQYAEKWEKDPAIVELVLQESRRVVRQVGPILITETRHGFICANSGVDQSSSGGEGIAVALPIDPDASAATIRRSLKSKGVDAAVIVSDTFGRPWREAQTDIAIGIAGMQPVTSYIGQVDPHGHEFRVQALCTADEIAGAAELVKGNISRVPVAVVRGLPWEPDDTATMQSIIRDSEHDLFR
ncbi:MAG TPA: coenzyme F420-0:L-glutamate ligase [Tepidiformaceae bacterium]|nr:coenzyme F420-0:L-glutamate ligase [Tepidiformaceae bacterium]